MATYDTSEFRNGLKIEIEGVPYEMVYFQFVKPGKGTAFTRTKLKNMISGSVIERTYRSGEVVTIADLDVTVMFFKGKSVSVTLPFFIESEITYCEPGMKGNTATGTTKPATLATGAIVQVPLFVDVGEIIRVDTRTGSYVSRVGK